MGLELFSWTLVRYVRSDISNSAQEWNRISFSTTNFIIKIAALTSKQIYKAHESVVHHGFQVATVKPQNALNNKLHCAL